MKISEEQCPKGTVDVKIEYCDGRADQTFSFKNTILRKGREALAKSLTNDVGDSYNFYISRMIFGDGGTQSGVIKFVNTNRNGLFGLTRASKPVISSIDSSAPTQAIFTSVLTYSEANGFVLSEMALVMNTGDLYSMATFPDLSKTEQMQITWVWRASFV